MTDTSVRENGGINGGNRSAYARTCYSSLKLSDLVDYLDATNRRPVRTEVEVHKDIASIEVEAIGAAEAVRP